MIYMGKNELEEWEKDTKTTKGAAIFGIVTASVCFIKYLSRNQELQKSSQELQKINTEISECYAIIQELELKWFKSSEEKQRLENAKKRLENAKKRREQLLKQQK